MHPGPAPHPLPAELSDPFLVREGLELGVRRKSLRSSRYERRVWGVRSQMLDSSRLLDRLHLLSARLRPEVFFSHSTAALFWGAPLPWRLEADPDVHVTVPPPARAPHAHGLRGHRRVVLDGDVVAVSGVRVSSPERMWWELAGMVDLADLVAAGDHLIHHRRPLTEVPALADRLRRAVRVPGLTTAITAISMLDDRAESRPESRTRVIFLSAGLTPLINHVLIETEDGHRYRPDFTFSQERLIVEYQGEYHRTLKQWRADMTRRGALEARGWRVLEINADDLRDPDLLLGRVRALLAR